ncbi:MAG TPA: hypothetical protein V6D03_04650, partial [Candidatus Caenarcaniphilales bacterium]
HNFVYFPAVIALLGSCLASLWHAADQKTARKGSGSFLKIDSKKAAAFMLLIAFVSGLTVVWDLGYLKNQHQRADLLAPVIQNVSQAPTLIAMTHKHHGQTGRLIGLAWALQHTDRSGTLVSKAAPQFLLIHQEPDSQVAPVVLQQALAELPRPLDLWLLNFKLPVDLAAQQCLVDLQAGSGVADYHYQLFHCVSQ